MSYKYESVVNVIGHINPDTDSVCSAIAYANLKSQSTGEKYIPKRAGQINAETQFVLKHFGVSAPLTIWAMSGHRLLILMCRE